MKENTDRRFMQMSAGRILFVMHYATKYRAMLHKKLAQSLNLRFNLQFISAMLFNFHQ